ncbi:MAG TPA: hypothetical protein VLD37_03790 [Candidatus Bilamarchaeum sp.]|nr:hypothetical protein [Candidatus Bilamarchaeum sp.]
MVLKQAQAETEAAPPGPNPFRPEAPVARQSAEIALASLSQLSLHSSKVSLFLSSAPAQHFSEEDIFSSCERGHERPATIVGGSEEADRRVDREYQKFRSAVPNNAFPASVSPDSAQSSGPNAEGHEAVGLLGESFLGPVISGRLRQTPPVFTTAPRSFFDALEQAEGAGANAYYSPGTNHIIIADDLAVEADRRRTILHETLHYAAHLGGGDPSNMRWRGAAGAPVFNGARPSAVWLHEGLAELYAQQLTRNAGHDTTYSSYPQQLRVAFMLQKLVEDDSVLRRAFLTGNFTEVRRIVDGKLGAGSFDAVMAADTPSGALMELTSRMTSAGIDFSPWLSDPLLKIARPKQTITK